MSRALLRLIWALGIMFMAGWVGVALAILALDPVKTETIPFWGFVAAAGSVGALLLYRVWSEANR